MNHEIVRLAPAKLNLSLELLSKRADGYHELISVMHAIDLCDRVGVSRLETPGVQLDVDEPSVPSDETNLAHQAATLFLQRQGIDQGVRLSLEKKIPAGGGLGGGSSDAAAVFLALNELFDCGLDLHIMAAWAAELGSDISFFVYGGTARCEGRGERITPIASPIQALRFIIYVSGIEVSTGQVYREVSAKDLTLEPQSATLVESCIAQGDVSALNEAMQNDLEPVSLRLQPELAKVHAALNAQDAQTRPVRMSGSGSCLFSVHASDEETARAIDWVRTQNLPVTAIAAQSLLA